LTAEEPAGQAIRPAARRIIKHDPDHGRPHDTVPVGSFSFNTSRADTAVAR
jgi:hypothetical protein